MINTLNVASMGLLANRTPLTMASLGWLSVVSGLVFLEAVESRWTLRHHDMAWNLAK